MNDKQCALHAYRTYLKDTNTGEECATVITNCANCPVNEDCNKKEIIFKILVEDKEDEV